MIIDSEYALYRLWRDQFHRYGRLLTTEVWAEYRTRANNLDEVVVTILAGCAGVSASDLVELPRQVAAQHRRALATLPARPGINAWLDDADRAGWRSVVLSDEDPAVTQHVLAGLGLSERVEVAIPAPHGSRSCIDDTTSGPYQHLLAVLDVDVARTVIATASPIGVAHARATGCACLAVPDKLNIHLLRSEPGVVVVNPEWITFGRAASLLSESIQPQQRRPHSGCHRPERIRGALAGLALGDAIGRLVGYRAKEQLDTETQDMLDALSAGARPPAIFTGRITDDTILTLALADTIIAHGYVSRDAFQACLKTINPQGGWQVFKLKASVDQVIVARDGDTNGCVPRSAVVAFLHSPDTLGDLMYDVVKTCTLTHSDRSALTVAVLFAVAVAHAIEGYSPPDTLDAIRSLHASVVRIVGGGEDVCTAIQRQVASASNVGTVAEYVDYLEETSGTTALARSSAVTGICLGLTGLPPGQVLPALLRRQTPGDFDSTAAVYGALAGAFDPNSVPTAWSDRIDQYCGRILRYTADRLQRIYDANK